MGIDNPMTSDTLPAIVVVGYNRPDSLRRLLDYLNLANYRFDNIELVISLDFCSSALGDLTQKVAAAFDWQHGKKRVILQPTNMGLRNHVLACGDLSESYGAIILLEDDLSVGPDFYHFAKTALDFSDQQPSIGGISLYNHKTNFLNQLPFEPIYDGYDNYYLQIASSWGQAWSHAQWASFRKWYDEIEQAEQEKFALPFIGNGSVPKTVMNWPPTSWLKYFIRYLAETNTYFLYPHHSHTTNHSDSGTHIDKPNNRWQVPLAIRTNSLRFSSPADSLSVYDSHFEISQEKLKQMAPTLNEFDFDVDLFGTKDPESFTKPYVLTSKRPSAHELQFDLVRKPMAANFLRDTPSSKRPTFYLCQTKDMSFQPGLSLNNINEVEYFYGHLPIRTLLKNTFKYFLQKRK